MKKTIAWILAVLMLLPCCLTVTAVSDLLYNSHVLDSKTFDPESIHEKIYYDYVEAQRRPWLNDAFGIAEGWVRTKVVYGSAWQYVRTYDSNGNLLKQTDHSVGLDRTVYTYDENGNLIKMTAKGDYLHKNTIGNEVSIAVAYTYDKNGKLIKEVSCEKLFDTNDTVKTVRVYTYDANGYLKKETWKSTDFYRDKKITVEKGTITYAYNKIGDLIKTVTKTVQRWESETPRTTTSTDVIAYARTYDANGAQRKLVRRETFSSDGRVISVRKSAWAFDSSGRMTKVSDNENDVTGTYTYDRSGHLIKSSMLYGGDRMITTFTYDKNGRLIKSVCTETERDGDYETEELSYVYDRGGYLKKVIGKFTEYDAKDDDYEEKSFYYLLSYDNNGNLLKVRPIQIKDGELVVGTIRKYSYQNIAA